VSPGFTILDIAAGNGRYVAVAGLTGASVVAQAFTSTDGIQWGSSSQIGTGFWPYSITYGNGIFVGVGGNRIFRSADGLNWSVDLAPDGSRLSAITFGAGRFIAVGIGGITATSPDAIDWTTNPTATSDDLWSIVFGGEHFVAAGNNGVIVLSRDGAVWSLSQPGVTPLRGVAFGADRFVAVGWYGEILHSGQPCAPRLALQVTPVRQLVLWGPVGRSYRIEYAPVPHEPEPWPVLTEISSLPSSPYTIPDTTPWRPGGQFYRAALLP
jgi:hypothetical protein